MSVQITPRIEFTANLSYESLAEAYIGSVTTLMFGINLSGFRGKTDFLAGCPREGNRKGFRRGRGLPGRNPEPYA